MLRPRIIPCLLVKNKGLVKTVRFSSPKYVGDPINAVKIFNEKGADELMVLDIDATAKGNDPDFRMIENFAYESRMPLCYGGGIKTVAHAKTIISLGVEKISISSAAIDNPCFVAEVADAVGSQSTVVVLDVKLQKGGRYEVFTHNGEKCTGLTLRQVALELNRNGVGEIVINSIDRDGLMSGYDVAMVEEIRDLISVPLTVLGGAGSLEHIAELVKRFGIVGAAAGSLFVFKGVYKAVLINYPTVGERDDIFQKSLAKC